MLRLKTNAAEHEVTEVMPGEQEVIFYWTAATDDLFAAKVDDFLCDDDGIRVFHSCGDRVR